MSDYTKSQEYSDKDALASGDPEKLILGTDFDVELDAITVAIASKYDSSDIASQAQAEAGVSNTVLMTPLRVSQLINGSGAGLVGDIGALTDPNADRILFWDDSAGSVAYLTAGTGLTITGTTISVNSPSLTITGLSDYDPNKWVDHTAVSILAGTAMTGGGTIAANRTLNFDLTTLTALTSVDPVADYLVVYDASAVSHKKVLVSDMIGAPLGDGRWKLSVDQSVSVQTNALFNTAIYNNLQRGTFNTGTYTYTATTACRLLVHVHATCPLLNNGHSMTIEVQKNGVSVARDYHISTADSTNLEHSAQVTVALSLAASDTVKVQFASSTTSSFESDEKYTHFNIIELA